MYIIVRAVIYFTARSFNNLDYATSTKQRVMCQYAIFEHGELLYYAQLLGELTARA
jgi:hypothetical protein